MEADVDCFVFEELRHAFYPDPLFEQRIKEEMSRCHRYSNRACLSIVRLQSNGYFDWTEGWKRLVPIIDDTIRGSDVVGREPFNGRLSFLFPQTEQAGGEVAMERIKQLIDYEFLETFNGRDFSVECVTDDFPDAPKAENELITDDDARRLLRRTNQRFPDGDYQR